MHPAFVSRLTAIVLVSAVVASVHASAPDRATQQKIAALSVPFVPNAGQWDRRAAFAAQTFAGTLFVTTDGQLVYSLPGKPVTASLHGGEGSTPSPAARVSAIEKRSSLDQPRNPGWTLSETLVDARGQPRSMSQSTLKTPAGYRPMEGKVSYGIGNDTSKHADNLNTYERVNLGDLYPGINVQLRATGNNVEKIFTVAPQQDPGQINVKLGGADKLEIGSKGELIAHTGNGPVTFTAPVAFQETASGERTPVTVAYALNATDQRYGFTLGEYDHSQPLIIDPLLQSTYLGGTGIDIALALAIHPTSGEVYVAGLSFSTDLPGVTGGAQATVVAGKHAFVTRFNAALTTRLQSTYLGGTGGDTANALAIHPATGEVYIAGFTSSLDLPGIAGGAQSVVGAGTHAFVSRFNAALTTRQQSTYLAGTIGVDVATALAIHPATGEVYIAGYTTSNDLAGVGGGAQPVKSAGEEAFVSRFNAALTTRLQSTFHGGSGADRSYALAIHPASGDVYVAGFTTSPDLLSSLGGAQPAIATGQDAFVTRFNAALTARLQSTYLGGNLADVVYALAIHPASGEVYVAGSTTSTDLPGVSGGAQTVKSTNDDAFVTRFNAALTARLQSTYLGGNDNDEAQALAVHPATGEVYVAGYTWSSDLPGASGGAQTVRSGTSDAFVTRFNAALTTRVQSTYLDGTATAWARTLAIHPATGEVYIAGDTQSADLPGVSGGAQPAIAAPGDSFVSRLSLDLTGGNFVPNPFAFAPRLNVAVSSLQTSNAAQITGVLGNVPVSISGGNFAEYCVSSTAGCGCDVRLFGNVAGTLNNNQYVCVRQVAPVFTPGQAKTSLVVGGGWADFIVSTGTQITSCNLDIDGSGGQPTLSDSLMLVRAVLGFTGAAVTNGAIVGNPPRNTWALIRDYLNQNCGTSFAP